MHNYILCQDNISLYVVCDNLRTASRDALSLRHNVAPLLVNYGPTLPKGGVPAQIRNTKTNRPPTPL